MSSRGKRLLDLIAEKERLRQLNQPAYETTKGVDLRIVNTEHLKKILFSDSTNAVNLKENRSQKPTAHVTPIKRKADCNISPPNPALRNLNFSWNNVVPRSVVLPGSDQENQNTEFHNPVTTEHNYFTRNKFRDRNVMADVGNLLESDSPRDPFEDSGSSYCPSVDDNPIISNDLTSLESDSPRDPVEDSGSSYCPTVDGNRIISNSLTPDTDDPPNNDNFSTSENNNLSLSKPPEFANQGASEYSPNLGNTFENEGEQKSITCHKVQKNKTHISMGRNETNVLEVEQNVVSLGAAQKIEGKRIRDKGHSCFFCQKILCNNFARHIETYHANEIEVAKILSMPKQSKRRRDAFANLIRYGDFYHNCEVLSLKQGELILARRPSAEEHRFSSYSDYGPCPNCLGFLLKRQLWHHLKYKCPSKPKEENKNEDKTSGKGPMAESAALVNGILGNKFSPEFLDIIKQFRNDEISNRCKEDDTIMRYGAFLFEKYGTTQSEHIRQSMRQLGRLTIEMKEQGESFHNLAEVLIPEKFDSIVNATKAICKATQEDSTKRPEFRTPSLALKIGYAVKKCASIERGQCLRRGDLCKNRKYLGFLNLLELEWSVRISSNALTTLYSRKKSAEDLLPITSDLLKVKNFLDSEIKKAKENLSSQNYNKLVSLTLSRIILLNKRRSGETSKMTLVQYSSRPNWKDVGTEELKNTLTPLENKLASSLTIIKIIGKRGRIVPILLTKDMKDAVDLIISKRVQYDILMENPYVFAIPNTTASHMRGHECIKKWCSEAGLISPDLVTSTKLRKYVATVCQIFNLRENEYDWLARHLGHDIRVHREFYRLQENAVELTKVSRLLLAVDQGEAHKFAGKELKDINLTDLDGIEEGNTDLNDSDVEGIDEGGVGADTSLKEDAKTKKVREGSKKGNKNQKEKTKKKPWSTEEKELLLRKFKLHIKRGALPGKQDCTELMKEHDNIFADRKWSDLKFFIKNHLTKIRKGFNKT